MSISFNEYTFFFKLLYLLFIKILQYENKKFGLKNYIKFADI